MRSAIQHVAERKTETKQAPVYMYYFTWHSPVHDGKLKAYHTLDIPFVFENVDLATAMTGGRQDRYALQDRMSAAWTNFARTGNPNAKGLVPDWPAFDTTQRATMVIDNEWKIVNDPNGDERRELMAERAVVIRKTVEAERERPLSFLERGEVEAARANDAFLHSFIQTCLICV